jgi:cell division protein FtsA
MANRLIGGIDIGSTKITAVIALMEDEGGVAKVIGEASYPSGDGIRKGEITGIDEAINAVASALSGAERMAGLTISSAYVSINGKHIISNNNKGVVAIADQEISTDDIFRAMEQAKTIAIPAQREIIHLIPREFIVDNQGGIKDPESMTGQRLEVDAHIISATTTALHNLRKSIQTIGLRLDAEVFTGWAAAQAVLTPTEKELGVVLLDIGGGTTSIATFEEGAITYSTSIPFGGANVTRDLAAGLRLSLDDAEKVKLNVEKLTKAKVKPVEEDKEESKEGAKEEAEKEPKDKGDIMDVTELDIEGVKTISRKLFNEIVSSRIEEIFELVRDNIAQSNNDFKLPAGIVLTGGSSELPGITQIAKKVFGVPARIGYPRGLEGLVDGISTPAYAVAQGLILHGMMHDDYSTTSSRNMPSTNKNSAEGITARITGFFKNLLP